MRAQSSLEAELKENNTYLVIFDKATFDVQRVGLTVDSTLVTVDNTEITADSVTVGLSDIGNYSSFVQIPVKSVNSIFVKKTKLNDKSSISYTLEFEETNNYINNL